MPPIHGVRQVTKGAGALAAFLILLGGSGTTAQSAEVHCVVCSGPDATYRCRVQTPGLSNRRPALQYFCVSQIAKDKAHASCRVRRATDDACAGEERIYVMQAPPATGTPPAVMVPRRSVGTEPPAKALPPQDQRAKTPPASRPKGEPKTVGEMAKRSGRQIKQAGRDVGRAINKSAKTTERAVRKAAKTVERGAEKAGNAVSSAAKKSWRCVTSLFQNC